jgi:hypothetical protein
MAYFFHRGISQLEFRLSSEVVIDFHLDGPKKLQFIPENSTPKQPNTGQSGREIAILQRIVECAEWRNIPSRS